jgi:hypothetical protein
MSRRNKKYPQPWEVPGRGPLINRPPSQTSAQQPRPVQRE